MRDEFGSDSGSNLCIAWQIGAKKRTKQKQNHSKICKTEFLPIKSLRISGSRVNLSVLHPGYFDLFLRLHINEYFESRTATSGNFSIFRNVQMIERRRTCNILCAEKILINDKNRSRPLFEGQADEQISKSSCTICDEFGIAYDQTCLLHSPKSVPVSLSEPGTAHSIITTLAQNKII
jgi:hypothetical protein